MLVESSQFEPNPEHEFEGIWKLSGYLRGPALSINGLVHIPGIGDFQMSQIDLVKDPHPLDLGRRNFDELEEASKVLMLADDSKRENLQSIVIPDPMEGEQTWPQEDELKEAEAGHFKKVPKGTSKYQAEWILDDEEDQNKHSEDENESDEVESAMDDESTVDEEQDDADETETIPMSESDNMDRYDATMDVDEEKKLLEQFRKQRENEVFPDEVDTPYDVSSKVRFQKYRGLKSFRTSPWDTNENLPSDYAKIFQFENFDRTKKRVLNEERDGAMNGWYICIHLMNVPKASIESLAPTAPLVVYGILPHEQKISVLNCVLRKQESCRVSVKSKDKLIFHVGYRRFSANPIFSQHTNGDKHKFERFLSDNSAVVASMFAPIIFPPASVLVFKMDSKGQHRFVAAGNVVDANPSRVVVKRIILSGHPFKINKRTAVIRYMFFNREDILWFKPVELRTKYGRRGHIKEPLGTHGHMKCHFDKPITAGDTILMDLYKRVFPKWNYDPTVTRPVGQTDKSSEIME